jgi:hypothetical protein
MSVIPSYPKVYAIGSPPLDGLFMPGEDVTYIVQEKVDGSQFSFGKVGGVLGIRSKGQDITHETGGMFLQGIEYVKSIERLLPDNVIFRGEFLGKPKHNVLAYDKAPENNIILFDVQVPNEYGVWRYLTEPGEVGIWAFALYLTAVPYTAMKIASHLDVQECLEWTSCLGGQPVEGVVVKRYDKLSRFGEPLFGKYVSERFKEKHGQTKYKTTGKDLIGDIIGEYKTEARWEKAVIHLRERGELTGTPKDIGLLMREFAVDFEEECSLEIMDRLWKHYRKIIIPTCQKGLAEWYKDQLLQGAFE